jgi:Pyridoxamine 5'-phosphate oxidase
MAAAADSFAPLEQDFLRITAATVFCVATPVDEHGRPRSRMLHPIFVVRDERPIGWALTGRTPLKTRHLEANPHLACAYWTPSHDTVFVDCVATWVDDEAEARAVWKLLRDTPAPPAWGAAGLAGYGQEEWRSPLFTLLRLSPRRVQAMRRADYSPGRLAGTVWRPAGSAPPRRGRGG